MVYRQLITPKLNINATIGWCLQYVDDAVNAPKRTPSATVAYQTEKANGTFHVGMPPENVWVTIFFRLSSEQNGHVAWYKKENGITTIADSNQRAQGQPMWSSIEQIQNALRSWIGGTSEYLGWSETIDGIRAVEYINDYVPPIINQGEKPMLVTLTSTYKDLKEGESYLISNNVAEHVVDGVQYDAMVSMFGSPKKIDAGSLWQFGRFGQFDVYKAGKKINI